MNGRHVVTSTAVLLACAPDPFTDIRGPVVCDVDGVTFRGDGECAIDDVRDAAAEWTAVTGDPCEISGLTVIWVDEPLPDAPTAAGGFDPSTWTVAVLTVGNPRGIEYTLRHEVGAHFCAEQTFPGRSADDDHAYAAAAGFSAAL